MSQYSNGFNAQQLNFAANSNTAQGSAPIAPPPQAVNESSQLLQQSSSMNRSNSPSLTYTTSGNNFASNAYTTTTSGAFSANPSSASYGAANDQALRSQSSSLPSSELSFTIPPSGVVAQQQQQSGTYRPLSPSRMSQVAENELVQSPSRRSVSGSANNYQASNGQLVAMRPAVAALDRQSPPPDRMLLEAAAREMGSYTDRCYAAKCNLATVKKTSKASVATAEKAADARKKAAKLQSKEYLAAVKAEVAHEIAAAEAEVAEARVRMANIHVGEKKYSYNY